MYRHRLAAVHVLVVLALLVVGCVPESERSPSAAPTSSAPSPTASPSASPADSPTAQPTPESTALAGVPDCWTVPVPDVEIESSQTPAEFAEQNPALVESGAPSPCSLFAAGALVGEGDLWLDDLVGAGWTDRGRVSDDVYVSRSVQRDDGLIAAFIAPSAVNASDASTQFQIYPG